jgi:cation transport ATPase
VAAEALSDHPLAAAVVRDGRTRLASDAVIPEAGEVRSVTGRGLTARIDGDIVFVGKKEMFAEVGGPPVPMEVRDRGSGAQGPHDHDRAAGRALPRHPRPYGHAARARKTGDCAAA